MRAKCPKCSSVDITTVKPKGVFLWIGLALSITAALMGVAFSAAERVIPWIIGLVIADFLVTLPLMAALRARIQYSGTPCRCLACGTPGWSKTSSTA